jgi:beta-galactosidase
VFEDVRLNEGANKVEAVGDHGGETVADTVEWDVESVSNVNIAAGRLASGYVSEAGTRFGSDHYFSGGEGVYIDEGEDARGGAPDDISNTIDPQLYKYVRQGEFSYDVPLPDGTYEVTLGFLEPNNEREVGERVFSVTANGETLLSDFDILEEAEGTRRVLTRIFTVEVSGGNLLLEFEPTQGDAVVSTIKVTNTETGGADAGADDEAESESDAGTQTAAAP